MATTRCHPGNVAALTMSLNLSSGISLGGGTLRRSTTIGCRSRAFCCTSSRRGLTASRATPTTTPSATGASFAHSYERTCESIWPTACKSNIRVLQQLSSVPPSPVPGSSPLRTGQGASTGVGRTGRRLG
jgi:hypothetical protein